MQDRHKTKQQLIEELASLRTQLELREGGGGDTIHSAASPTIPPEHYATIFDQFPLGISVIRKDGFFIYVNPAFVSLTGYNLPDIDREKKWFQTAYPDKEYRRRALYAWVKYQTQKIITEKIFQVSCKNRKKKSIEFNMITVKDGTVISMLTEVTGYGEAGELLREKEEQWRLLLDTMNEGFITVNESGIPVFVNQRFCEMTGYTQEELIGRPVSAYLDAENLRTFQSEFSQRSNGRLSPYEIVLRRKDGSPMYFLMSPRPLYDSSGRFAGSFGTCMDISERKEMEKVLKKSEEKLQMALYGADLGMWDLDLTTMSGTIDERAAQILGYGKDEIPSQIDAWDAMTHPEDIPRLKESLNAHIEGHLPVFENEHRMRMATGEWKWVQGRGKITERHIDGSPILISGTMQDIDNRKRVEEELRKRKERLKALANNLPGVIFQFYVRKHGEMGLYYVSERSREILGLDSNPEEFFARASACVPLEDRSRFLESIQQAALSVCRWEYEGRFITTGGEEKYVRGISLPEERPDEVVFNGMLLDITDQKRAEDALEESRKRYQYLVESINEIVWEIDATGRFTYLSPNIEKLIGYGQAEMIGKFPHEYMWAMNMEELKGRFSDSFASQYPFVAIEGIIVHKRGIHLSVEVSGNPFFIKEGHFGGYRGILRDISEIKTLQEEMIKTQKLESIGTLAGGVAHDFNNLLMGILGYIGLAKLNAQQEMVVERSLSKAEESCLRAKEIAQRLLTFSRGGDPQMKPIDIRDAVRESVKLVLRGSNIQCRYYLAKHLHPVRADEAQIRQAIGNIIINAVEASPAGGSISVKGENVAYRRKAEKPFIKLTISDRGKGISEESLGRIFDPYFTTKDMGSLKGTGLGLSISYSIIKKHGGDVTVQSEVGKGTSVSIYLPACVDITQVIRTAKGDLPVSGRPEAAVKRILVMDDEALIRSFMEDTMSFLGYDVTTCDEGSKAVEMYREAMALRPYDLVVLDLTVRGGWGGQETIQRLLDVDPAVMAIICSGYSDDPVISHYGAYGFKGALAKPASIDQIKTTLDKIFNN